MRKLAGCLGPLGHKYSEAKQIWIPQRPSNADNYKEMQKSDINILIIEDDRSFAQSCADAIRTAGYSVTVVHNAQQATEKLGIQAFQVAIIDCMLPKKPGVDFAKELYEAYGESISIVLMSGIYKDKGFIREAKQQTKAETFLTKPFALTDLIESIDSQLDGVVESPKDPIPSLFANQRAKTREILDAIDMSESIHGFELPFIYSLFMNAKLSGQMNVIEASGRIFGVSFSGGKIVAVETDDPPTKLGELLVEKGYLRKGEIEEALEHSPSMRIGETLVNANLLSPHALNEVLADQLQIRLTKTILNSSLELNFTKSDAFTDFSGLELDDFVPLLNRWFTFKIPIHWTKTYYLPWLDHTIVKGSMFDARHPVLNAEIFLKNPNFPSDLISHETLQQLISKNFYEEEDIYACLHLLTITRYVGFGETEKASDFESQFERLEKLYKQIENKNKFEILNLSKNAKPDEIRRAYHDFAKALHPDRLDRNAPEELRQLNDQVFSIITDAHNTIKDPAQREIYLSELREGHAKQQLEAENIFESGKNMLKAGKFSLALPSLEQARAVDPENPLYFLYYAWATLKSLKKTDYQRAKDIESGLGDISQNYRSSPEFFFVKGLLHQFFSNFSYAKTQFEAAIEADPDFLEARRELNILKLKKENNKPVDLLRADLKDVVGMLFKKK